jgi:hypothetical protein
MRAAERESGATASQLPDAEADAAGQPGLT